MPVPPLVIRADALPETGSGHVMRCLAAAEAWQDSGGRVVFISTGMPGALVQRLKDAAIEVVFIDAVTGSSGDAAATVAEAARLQAPWIIADSYLFGNKYQQEIRNAGRALLSVDDCGYAKQYSADLVLNQNGYARPDIYADRDPGVRLLLGPKYALIRREFLNNGSRHSPGTVTEQGRRVLVTFGGSDPGNLTLKVIRLLQGMQDRDLEVVIVAGGINPHYDHLQEAVHGLAGFTLQRNVQTMPDLMGWADLAISAGGSTSWEFAYMGVPAILCPVADNQRELVRDLGQRGIARVLASKELDGDAAAALIETLLDSPQLRAGMVHRMQDLVDGGGADRVVSAMQPATLRLRRARMGDCRRVYAWASDPVVRNNSFSTGPIPFENHRAWFSAAVNSPDTVYYIALDAAGEPLGQARFQTSGSESVISVLVGTEHRGRGFGADLIRAATAAFRCETGAARVHAYIKPENAISKKAFLSAGFTDRGLAAVHGQDALHLVA